MEVMTRRAASFMRRAHSWHITAIDNNLPNSVYNRNMINEEIRQRERNIVEINRDLRNTRRTDRGLIEMLEENLAINKSRLESLRKKRDDLQNYLNAVANIYDATQEEIIAAANLLQRLQLATRCATTGAVSVMNGRECAQLSK